METLGTQWLSSPREGGSSPLIPKAWVFPGEILDLQSALEDEEGEFWCQQARRSSKEQMQAVEGSTDPSYIRVSGGRCSPLWGRIVSPKLSIPGRQPYTPAP